MNEKFLSRGKREDTGKWVKGYYVELPEDQHGKKLCLIIGLDGQYNRIIPETAGRCTGETDKFGTMIFEGDIIHRENGDFYEIAYMDKYMRFVSRRPNTVFSIFSMETAKVVGNVHDNPELIGRADTPVSDDISQPVLMPATPENFELIGG